MFTVCSHKFLIFCDIIALTKYTAVKKAETPLVDNVFQDANFTVDLPHGLPRSVGQKFCALKKCGHNFRISREPTTKNNL